MISQPPLGPKKYITRWHNDRKKAAQNAMILRFGSHHFELNSHHFELNSHHFELNSHHFELKSRHRPMTGGGCVPTPSCGLPLDLPLDAAALLLPTPRYGRTRPGLHVGAQHKKLELTCTVYSKKNDTLRVQSQVQNAWRGPKAMRG